MSNMDDQLLNELAKRDVERSRKHKDPTIQRALTVLGQDLNPINVMPFKELTERYHNAGRSMSPDDERGLGGFRFKDDPRIHINESSAAYQAAKQWPKNKAIATALASTLAHEQVHNTETGPEGEYPAYRLQADYLQSQRDNIKDPSERELFLQILKEAEESAQALDPARKRKQ